MIDGLWFCAYKRILCKTGKGAVAIKKNLEFKMSSAHIFSAERSDTGKKRRNNEDAALSLPERGVFCVADGMGGAEEGEVASRAVVDAMNNAFDGTANSFNAATALEKAKSVRKAVNEASCRIKKRADARGVQGTGTTVVVLALDDGFPVRALILHAGDSRAYIFRDSRLRRLTHDHSIAEALRVRDRDELPPMFRGIITRAVGIDYTVDLEETPADVAAGDLFMLCSDGLTGMLSDKALENILRQRATGSLEEAAGMLIDEANRAGGADNISVILVRIGEAA